jgi:catechol 2,3-dioxygenase-like lactoylglutathione lyase family enzyme
MPDQKSQKTQAATKPAKLRHIAITVPDPEKAAAFYERSLGLKRVGGTDWAGARGVYLSDGVINLALLQYKTDEFAGERGTQFVGLHHFGFVVEDIDRARESVEQAGAKHWMGEPADGTGFYEVKYFDPNGVVFDITENGWTGAAKD